MAMAITIAMPTHADMYFPFLLSKLAENPDQAETWIH